MACANSNRLRTPCTRLLHVTRRPRYPRFRCTDSKRPSPSRPTPALRRQSRRTGRRFSRGQRQRQRKRLYSKTGRNSQPLLAQPKTQATRATTVKVTKVEVLSKTLAHVVYTIYLGGSPAESNAIGVALLQDKVWKVSDAELLCARKP